MTEIAGMTEQRRRMLTKLDSVMDQVSCAYGIIDDTSGEASPQRLTEWESWLVNLELAVNDNYSPLEEDDG